MVKRQDCLRTKTLEKEIKYEMIFVLMKKRYIIKITKNYIAASRDHFRNANAI